jgi:hypothetical protein
MLDSSTLHPTSATLVMELMFLQLLHADLSEEHGQKA